MTNSNAKKIAKINEIVTSACATGYPVVQIGSNGKVIGIFTNEKQLRYFLENFIIFGKFVPIKKGETLQKGDVASVREGKAINCDKIYREAFFRLVEKSNRRQLSFYFGTLFEICRRGEEFREGGRLFAPCEGFSKTRTPEEEESCILAACASCCSTLAA